tara:strand:+ start:18 stop:1787 length:1770 start_codon:yes stop_codon:yes gene_type:complete
MAQKLKIDIVAKDRSKQALQGLQGSLARLKNSVFNLRNAFIGLGAGLVIKGIVKAGIQVEMLGVQLKSLMGSAEAGKKALVDILEFAKTTPFELKNIQQGVTSLATVRKQAAAAGIDFKELMTITGNTATLLGGDFAMAAMQIQRAFGSSIGAADLFRDRGVSAMAGFKAGATYNAQQSIEGLKGAFGTDGEFGSLMGDLAKTLFGTISNLKDAFFRLQVYISEAFFGELKKQFGDLKTTIEANEEKIRSFGTNVGAVLSSAIRGTSSAMQFMAENIKTIIETLRVLIALKIVGFFYNLAVAIGVAKGAMLGFNSAVRKNILIMGGILLISQLDRIIKKFKELTGLFGDKTVTDVKSPFDDIREAAEALAKSQKEITKEVEKQAEPVKNIKEQFNEINKGAIAKIEEKIKNINTIVATGISSGITKMSDGLARSIILGEKLSDTFKKMAGELLVKILSTTIEVIARKGVELAIEKLITKEKQKQLALSGVSNLMGLGSLGGFFRKQHGGAVSKGTPTIVGERGPELFVPNQTGQITQNARGTGGGSVNVNFTINTIDSRGFDEALVENRGTITSIINNAMNEKGARGIV